MPYVNRLDLEANPDAAEAENVLVSAGAGTGKTAVLIERVLQRVLDRQNPVPLENLLVVTFTEAATAELRQRVIDALYAAAEAGRNDPALRSQLECVERGEIDTITTLDSFCLKILRENALDLGLSPGFRVLDQWESEILRRQTLERLLAERYSAASNGGDPRFASLVEAYYNGASTDDGLKGIVLRLHDLALNHPWPEEWLARACDSHRREHYGFWLRLAERSLAVEAEKAAGYLAVAEDVASAAGLDAYLQVLRQEREMFSFLHAICGLQEGTSTSCAPGAEPGTETVGRDALHDAIASLRFGRLPPARTGGEKENHGKDLVKSLRQKAKRCGEAIKKQYSTWMHERAESALESAGQHAGTLCALVRDLIERLREAKLRAGVIGLSDIEQMCLRLLLSADSAPGRVVPSELCLDIRKRFHEVLVDEYQDINPVQDLILWLVSPRLFMVGDLKQSIYGFRMAEPRVFLRKYLKYGTRPANLDDNVARTAPLTADESSKKAVTATGASSRSVSRHEDMWAPAGDGIRVDLLENRRSRPEIVDAVNFIFRQIMTGSVCGFDYFGGSEMVSRSNYPAASGARHEWPVELHVVVRERNRGADDDGKYPGQRRDALQYEVQLAAALILEMVQGSREAGPLQVVDKGSGQLRNVRWEDIAVLLRAPRGRSGLVVETLNSLGVPAAAEVEGADFSSPEVKVALSLLSIVDNPCRDMEMATVLASPVVGLSPSELAFLCKLPGEALIDRLEAAATAGAARAANGDGERRLAALASSFLEKLKRWRAVADRWPLRDLALKVLRESGYLSLIESLPGGHRGLANLETLLEKVAEFEASTGRGLGDFLNLVGEAASCGIEWAVPAAPSYQRDRVSVLSIHRSKGLEFPVVFVLALGGRFNLEDLRGDVILHRDLGPVPLMVEADKGIKYPTLAYVAASAEAKRSLLAEEMRTLYVALTRAREKLVLVGSFRGLQSKVEKWGQLLRHPSWPLPDWVLLDTESALDWIIPAILRHRDGRSLLGAVTPVTEASGRNPAVFSDPSRWRIALHSPQELENLAATLAGRRSPHEPPAVSRGNRVMGMSASSSERVEPESSNLLKDALQKPIKGAPESLSNLAPSFKTRPASRQGQSRGGIPAKVAATALGGDWARVPADLLRRMPYRGADPGAASLTEWEDEDQPLYIPDAREVDRSRAGSVAHLVLRHLDLAENLDIEGIRQQAVRMVRRRLLLPQDLDLVPAEEIARFFSSPLGTRVRQAGSSVSREVPFTMLLSGDEIRYLLELGAGDAHPLLAAAPGDEILIQGAIDCLVEEPGGLLVVDYKTDTIESEEEMARALKRYRIQMEVYKRAASRLFRPGRVEAYLYFLKLGVACPIE